jgi:hypothetical protein
MKSGGKWGFMHGVAQNAFLGLCLGAILFAAGCASPVKTDYKAGTDFSRYRTFTLMPLPQSAPADDPGLMLRLAQPAREAVISSLTAKGLAETATAQADLAVNLRGESLPRVEITDYGYTYPLMTRAGTVTVVRNPYTSVSSYNERTLIIELLDTRTKELVWVGWTKKNSSRPVSPESLQEAIRKILEEFPPAVDSGRKKP